MFIIYTSSINFLPQLVSKYPNAVVISEANNDTPKMTSAKLVQLGNLLLSGQYTHLQIIENSFDKKENEQALVLLTVIAEQIKAKVSFNKIENQMNQLQNKND